MLRGLNLFNLEKTEKEICQEVASTKRIGWLIALHVK